MLTGGNCGDSFGAGVWLIVTLDLGFGTLPEVETFYSEHVRDYPGADTIPPDVVWLIQAAQVGPAVVFTSISVVTCRVGR
ncbi:unnamed protein product [marine sediment metagenome]|uniref:Uncharacterized protein n=1 Tax=marine sediment metagenome TaxID=412755 RepID=X1RUZ1_9ZZZZ